MEVIALIFENNRFSTIKCDSLEKRGGIITKDGSFKYLFNNGIALQYILDSSYINSELFFRYKEMVLVKEKGLSLTNVANLMNHYSKLSIAEVKELYSEALANNKSKLESELETLKKEKLTLEKEIANLKQAFKLKEELKEILSQL